MMNWLSSALLHRMFRYGADRLREASTWRNLILLLGGSWASTHPQQAESLIPVCLGLAGFIGSFFPDWFGMVTDEKNSLPSVSTDDNHDSVDSHSVPVSNSPPSVATRPATPVAHSSSRTHGSDGSDRLNSNPDRPIDRLRQSVPPDRRSQSSDQDDRTDILLPVGFGDRD